MLRILFQADTATPAYTTQLFANTVQAEDADDGLESEEENKDLKRQVVFLKQQMENKDRKIKELENQLASGIKKSSSVVSYNRRNSATQVITA